MTHAQDGKNVFVRLFRGEELFTTLEKLVADNDWKSGFVSGIGAMEDIEMGAYDLSKKEYHRKKLEGIYELSNLQGNFSKVDNKPFFHLHGVVSDHSLNTLGGHFFSLKTAATCEVKIQLFDQKIIREYDDEIGLKLLKFCGA